MEPHAFLRINHEHPVAVDGDQDREILPREDGVEDALWRLLNLSAEEGAAVVGKRPAKLEVLADELAPGSRQRDATKLVEYAQLRRRLALDERDLEERHPVLVAHVVGQKLGQPRPWYKANPTYVFSCNPRINTEIRLWM